MKTILICITAIFGFASSIDITGRWETQPSEKGNITGIVFKSNNTFEGYVNKKPFASGTYTFNAADTLLTIQEGSCGGVAATYKVNFFSNADSIRFTVVEDSCTQRKQGVQRMVLGRVIRKP